MCVYIYITIPDSKEDSHVLKNILISVLSSHLLTSYPTFLVIWQLYMHNSWTYLISNAFLCTNLGFCVLQVEMLTWTWISALRWPTVWEFFFILTVTNLYPVFFQTWLSHVSLETYKKKGFRKYIHLRGSNQRCLVGLISPKSGAMGSRTRHGSQLSVHSL